MLRGHLKGTRQRGLFVYSGTKILHNLNLGHGSLSSAMNDYGKVFSLLERLIVAKTTRLQQRG